MPVEVGVGTGNRAGRGFGSDSVYAGGRAKRSIESRDGHKFLGHTYVRGHCK